MAVVMWLIGHLPELLCVAVVLWVLAERDE
jgi:hypothetical protein